MCKGFSRVVTCILISFMFLFASCGNGQDEGVSGFGETSDVATASVNSHNGWLAPALKIIKNKEYLFKSHGNSITAQNRAQDFSAQFEIDSLALAGGKSENPWYWSWQFSGIGRLGFMADYNARSLSIGTGPSPLVQYDRGDLVEWYANDATGIEQGFDILFRPAGEGLLIIEGTMESDLTPRLNGEEIIFSQKDRDILRYHTLVVFDSAGQDITSWMELDGNTIRLVIDDQAAYYPLYVDPALSASAEWSAESDQDYASFGNSVASAGDVNGDGYGDVIIGAFFYDNGENTEGRAYVYHGSATGLPTEPSWVAEPNELMVFFGESVASAGDVNGDGYDDVIIGADGWDNPEINEGAAFVYYGSASGLSANADWTVEANQEDAGFGYAVDGAGDVNGDGYDDVVIGARSYSNGQNNEGMLFVYHGSATGLSTTANWTFESDVPDVGLGDAVAAAGDVNGDGFDDIIAGARYFTNGEVEEGRAFLFFGAAVGLAVSPSWMSEGNQLRAEYANSVASAGDVNGDGFDDVIIGSEFYDAAKSGEGAAFVYYGSPAGLGATADWMVISAQADAWFGCSVASAGDVNGDGFDDVIIGAKLYDNGQDQEGMAFLYLGSSSGLTATADWTAESDQAEAKFGNCVSSAGNVNGDSVDDVIVGAIEYDNGNTDEGAAFVYYGLCAGCEIDNKCYMDGDYVGCGVCDTSKSITDWTAMADGESCDDDLFCNGTDQCSDGVCVHSDDACEADEICNEETDSCDTADDDDDDGGADDKDDSADDEGGCCG